MAENHWLVTDTVRTDRKDIFSFSSESKHYVGTLISGSRIYIERFEKDISLIKRSPEMKALLTEFVQTLSNESSLDPRLRELTDKASRILTSIDDTPFSAD